MTAQLRRASMHAMLRPAPDEPPMTIATGSVAHATRKTLAALTRGRAKGFPGRSPRSFTLACHCRRALGRLRAVVGRGASGGATLGAFMVVSKAGGSLPCVLRSGPGAGCLPGGLDIRRRLG